MWQKILAITRKELYRTFTDRNLLILMIVAPLGISTVVGLVFGGLGSNGGSFSNIPVAIVNLDTGADQQGQTVNYGDQLVGLFIPNDDGDNNFGGDCPLLNEETADSDFNQPLDELVTAQQIDDVAVGRDGVESGDYAVLITIPADFSASLTPNVNVAGSTAEAVEPTAVEIYANSGSSIEGVIVRSVVEGFTNQLLTGNIAIGASINAIIQENPLNGLQLAAEQSNPEVAAIFGCGFMSGMATINVDQQALATGGDESGPSIIQLRFWCRLARHRLFLFALFAGQFGVLSIITERRAGTLQADARLAHATQRDSHRQGVRHIGKRGGAVNDFASGAAGHRQHH